MKLGLDRAFILPRHIVLHGKTAPKPRNYDISLPLM